MNAKEYLSQPFKLREKIKYLKLDLERYERMIYACTSPNYMTERIDKSPSVETCNQKALEKYYTIKDKIDEKTVELEENVEEVSNIIDSLDNEDYKLLLKYRYLDNRTFVEIQEKLFTSYSTVKRWHNEALIQVSLILNHNKPS